MIRKALPTDLPYLYEICHKTGYYGGDATGRVQDPYLLGHLFAAPYLWKVPGWCFLAVDSLGPVGYLLSAPDTRDFETWGGEHWLPGLRDLYPRKEIPGLDPFEQRLRDAVWDQPSWPGFTEEYPGHLHIDVLPRGQGTGLGRKLVESFLGQARDTGLKGFHLGVNGSNVGALAFYAKMGFGEIGKESWGVYLGMKL